MTEEHLSEEKENTIKQLAALAKESESSITVNWDAFDIQEDEAFIMMASNVVEQMESVPEEHKAAVCMATMTKLLVENFVLNLQLKSSQNEQ